jgi:prepilin-type N-terminal cleavage/methylation domain-containing protein
MMIPKQKLPSLPSTESGFTLIECLIAIIIVGVLMVAIAPAVVLSSATRVQARRVELATQAAQFYMDGLRSGRIPPPPYGIVTNLNPTQTLNTAPSSLQGFTVPKGGSSFTCPSPGAQTLITPVGTNADVIANANNFYCKDANGYPYLYCVDLDRDAGCTKGDYIVQGFRSFTDLNDTGANGYMLGIRVYRADAMSINGDLKKTTVDSQGKSRKLATFTGGAGDRAAPLVETTTQIRTAQTTYDSLKQRLGVKSATPTSSPNP